MANFKTLRFPLKARFWNGHWLVMILSLAVWVQAAGADLEFFEKKVRPLLVEHCYECHSASSEKLKGGLLLDSKEGLLRGGDSGAAIVPGDAEASLLVKAVRYKDEHIKMPPTEPLPESSVKVLEEWIDSGAADPRIGGNGQVAVKKAAGSEDFWAARPPREAGLPPVRNEKWPKTSIDRFILAEIERNKLSPAAQANRKDLIRRATFDLIGIPPPPEEVKQFLADESPDAFETVVDRLLSSPLYGERWGRHWLDVVRYTDSNDARGIGGEADIPEAYRYRDWVVNAFNNDLPYDQFILQQFAGDLMQPSDPALLNTNAIIATGLLAIGEWGTGDADKEKMMTDIVDDQIDVTGRAFLGLTLACARCHDHKFDPISAEDYYGLAGIFFSSHILPSPGAKTAGSPVLRIPLAPKTELERRRVREERIVALEKEIGEMTDRAIGDLAEAMLQNLDRYLVALSEKQSAPETSAEQLIRKHDLDRWTFEQWLNFAGLGEVRYFGKFISNVLGTEGLHAWKGETDTPSATINTTAREVQFLTIKMPPRSVAFHPSPSGGVALDWHRPGRTTVRVSGKLADADPNCGDGVKWELKLRGPFGSKLIAQGEFANGGHQLIGQGSEADSTRSIAVEENSRLELAILPNGNHGCDTTVVELSIQELEGDLRRWALPQDVVLDPHEEGKGNPHSDPYGNRDAWGFYDLGSQGGIEQLPKESKLAKFLAGEGDTNRPRIAVAIRQELETESGKNDSAPAKVREILRSPRGIFWAGLRMKMEAFSSEDRDQLLERRAELSSLRANPPPALPIAHGVQEGGVPESAHAGIKDARVHIRGRYDRLGDTVPRRFPVVLAGDNQKPIEQGSGRLQLAQWLASPANPLTARVLVNRIWQHHFGEGLVRTPNNFGMIGEKPTHPELLDYLAIQFVKGGWSIKAMHKMIMLSAVYQQSTSTTDKSFEQDPENRLFSRVNRRRLDAEAFRDAILALNGTLELSQGGPSIRDINSRRRTIYQMAIRSIRNDYRSLFDAPDPSSIVEKRNESTVAPQALFLMNHPFITAEVRRLAERVLVENSRDDQQRIEWLYWRLFSRKPETTEVDLGRRMLEEVYKKSTFKAEEREISAWEAYCQVLLASNEFMYLD